MIQINHELLAEAMHAHDVRNCPEPKPALAQRPPFVQDYYRQMVEVVIQHIAEFNNGTPVERL